METKKRNIVIVSAIALVIVILIAGGIFLLINKSSANSKPSISGGEIPTSELDNTLIMNSKNLAGSMDEISLIGNWKAISEEVNGVKSDSVDSSIIFNADGTYSSNVNGLSDEGFYKIKELNGKSKIIFYYSEENLNIGNYQEAFGNVNGNELTLIYPAYPKVVVYNKE